MIYSDRVFYCMVEVARAPQTVHRTATCLSQPIWISNWFNQKFFLNPTNLEASLPTCH